MQYITQNANKWMTFIMLTSSDSCCLPERELALKATVNDTHHDDRHCDNAFSHFHSRVKMSHLTKSLSLYLGDRDCLSVGSHALLEAHHDAHTCRECD